MKQSAIENNHYDRLNDYKDTIEYAEYAKLIGHDVPDPLPTKSLLNDPWEINEEIYWYFLEMLPHWQCGAFYICEYTFDNITTKFSKIGDGYFCEFARL